MKQMSIVEHFINDKETSAGVKQTLGWCKSQLELQQQKIEQLETAIQDALSIAEMQKEDFKMEPWASLEEVIK